MQVRGAGDGKIYVVGNVTVTLRTSHYTREHLDSTSDRIVTDSWKKVDVQVSTASGNSIDIVFQAGDSGDPEGTCTEVNE